MKPVMQRGSSDCLRACIASIFEIPWEEAPSTERGKGVDSQDPVRVLSQHNTVNEWLCARGLVEWTLQRDVPHPEFRRAEQVERDGSRSPADSIWPYPVATHFVGSGMGPRGVAHAVVMRAGKIIHDPHPEGGMSIEMIDSIHVYVARFPW